MHLSGPLPLTFEGPKHGLGVKLGLKFLRPYFVRPTSQICKTFDVFRKAIKKILQPVKSSRNAYDIVKHLQKYSSQSQNAQKNLLL